MTQSFSFSFAGDDIEDSPTELLNHAAETGTIRKPTNTAFPISGHTMLPPLAQDLEALLATLPSKISYSTLNVTLDDGSKISIPRREWWDVRVQLMAEEHDAAEVGLGRDDIKTGVYEGGFKSWESSVDLVKVLAGKIKANSKEGGRWVLEMGCGTALPSLALLQWHLARSPASSQLNLTFADYNPSVLQLVSVPNILLSWAQYHSSSSWEPDGELDIDARLLLAFNNGLKQRNITLSFISGAWSPQFVHLVTSLPKNENSSLLVLAAETIYSPAALKSFTESLMAILDAEDKTDGNDEAVALVAAKKVYFGVGGSIEDFCDAVRVRGGRVRQIKEEEDGVRRAVVEVRREKGTLEGLKK